MIDDVLAAGNACMADLTCIGVCTGPGSFTGIRIGVAAARGLALGCGIPAIGISRFEALADGNDDGDVDVRLPGRAGQVYVQAFRDGAAAAPPFIDEGEAEDLLADPLVIARLAAGQRTGQLPAPLYLRGADAAPPREAPPVILDR